MKCALGPEVIARIQELITKKGLIQTAKLMTISSATLYRAVAGQRLHQGTTLVLQTAIAKRDAEGRNP